MRISDWNSDVCSSDLAEVPHQLLHARLGLGRERDLDIALPQRLAGLVLDGAEHALPARLLFLLSAHLPAVEIEMFLRKGLAQRSEERRVGKECVSTCRSRWSPYH